jgi:prepilin-type N-terminal cleavage/methylation domain-containing protein
MASNDKRTLSDLNHGVPGSACLIMNKTLHMMKKMIVARVNLRKVRRAGGEGFTLIEMIGVLAILAILVTLTVPSVIERINQARADKEMRELPVLAAALNRHILRAKTIPNQDWAQAIADELAIPINQVTISSTGSLRVCLMDPAIHIGTDTGILPYTQTAQGSADLPANARVMLISSQGLNLPGLISSGVAASSEIFDHIWDAPKGTIPEGWPAEWAGKGEYLQIIRINLAPLFRRLLVSPLTDGVTTQISVDGSAPISVPATGLSSYYLEGTVIGLYNNGQLESRDLLMNDRSYSYERGIWRGQLWEGKVKDATDLARGLDAFRTAQLNPQSGANASQQKVMDAYYNYVLTYATWARAGFSSYDVNQQPTSEYQSLNNAQNQLEVVSEALISQ